MRPRARTQRQLPNPAPCLDAVFRARAALHREKQPLPSPRDVRRPPHDRIRAAAATIVLGSCLAATGCSGASGGGTPTPVTTSRPTTTSPTAADPVAAVRAAVTAAQKRYYDAYRAAAADPSNQALIGALRAVYTTQSVSGDAIKDRIRWFADQKYAVRPEPGSYYVIENIAVDVLPPAGRAEATVCGYDTDIVVDAANRAPDGKDIIVSNTPSSVRTRTTWLQQSDGTWKLDGGVVVDSWQGENRCPPRPAGS